MKNLKILIATHKECELPKDEIFLPIQVGRTLAEKKLDMQGDDEGDNISEKNPNYCELTALYWAWKNLKDVDYIGLNHYRRYFNFKHSYLCESNFVYSYKSFDQAINNISKKPNWDNIFSKYDIVLVKPFYNTFSSFSHYSFYNNDIDMEILIRIILKSYPEYESTLLYFKYSTNKWIAYNMFICEKKLFDSYCEWLFNILFEVEKKVKLSPYSYYQRIYAYMGELLLPVFCHFNGLKVKYIPAIQIDNSAENLLPYQKFIRNIGMGVKNEMNNLFFETTKAISFLGSNKQEITEKFFDNYLITDGIEI